MHGANAVCCGKVTASDHECSVWVMQSATDYGPYIQNLGSPLHTTTLLESCQSLLVDQWTFLRANVSRSAMTVD